MARLQNSMVFRAASELDFQRDTVGSFSILMCDDRPDFNSSSRSGNLRLSRQMANKAVPTVGNNSGKSCRKLLYFEANLPATVSYVVMLK